MDVSLPVYLFNGSCFWPLQLMLMLLVRKVSAKTVYRTKVSTNLPLGEMQSLALGTSDQLLSCLECVDGGQFVHFNGRGGEDSLGCRDRNGARAVGVLKLILV